MPHEPGVDLPGAGNERPRTIERVENTVDAVVFLGVLLALGAVLSLLVLVQQMGVAACGPYAKQCDVGLLGVARWIVPSIVGAFAVLTVIAVVARWRTARRSRRVPVLGIGLTIVGFLVASILVRFALDGAVG